MASVSRNLVIISALLAVALSQGTRCKVAVPFTTKLVGKTFTSVDDCYRPSVRAFVKVFKNRIEYIPQTVVTFFMHTCYEKFVFRIRRGKDPVVVFFPEIFYKKGSDRGASREELDKFCKKKQPKIKEKYFPRGKTRKKFRRAVRRMVKDIKEIRDFGCRENEDGLLEQIEGRAFTNVDLDGIVTYLLGVAFEFNFCAEPK